MKLYEAEENGHEGFEVQDVHQDTDPLKIREMPHFETDDNGVVDLRVERWPISQAEKIKIFNLLHKSTVVGKDESGWRFFTPDNYSGEANPQQVRRLPKIPDMWKKYAQFESVGVKMTSLFKRKK